MSHGLAGRELLLLGKDHDIYGAIRVERVGHCSAAAISVGADPDSPSNQFKHDPNVRNEDALSVVDLGSHACLAVADAHYGPEASHMLVERLHKRWTIDRPRDLDDLAEMFVLLREGDEAITDSETTLLAAVYDRTTRTGFGLSIGDSSFVLVSRAGGVRTLNRRDATYVNVRHKRGFRRAAAFEFTADEGDLLLTFTDGVDECNYRSPSTSIQPHHIEATAEHASFDPFDVARALVELALNGVDGHPGGEDNIALIVSSA